MHMRPQFKIAAPIYEPGNKVVWNMLPRDFASICFDIEQKGAKSFEKGREVREIGKSNIQYVNEKSTWNFSHFDN